MAANVETILLRILGDSSQGEKALDKIHKRLLTFGAALTATSTAALVTFAKLGEGGAQIDALEGKFARMAAAFGKTADEMLSTWENAAAGTLSRAEMMRKANQAALLGLPVDRLAEMLAIARNAAESTGQSVEYMFDSLVVGIGRKSKMILDNLGIIFSAEEAYAAYAQSVGKAANQLTSHEQTLAFLEATTRAAARQQQMLGAATENASTTIARAKARFTDVKDEIAKSFIPVATTAAKAFTMLANLFLAIPEPVKAFIARLLALAAAAGAVLGPAMMLVGVLPLIQGALAAAGAALSSILPALLPIIAVVGILAAVVALAAKAWNENWGGIRETVAAIVREIAPYVQRLVRDIQMWVGLIKTELGAIVYQIRQLLEPAIARLRQMFGDGAGLKEFLVYLRDAAAVVLSVVLKILQAISMVLQGRAKDAWMPLKDAALNVITIIVITWRKYISKALIWGWNLVVNLANGIIKAARMVLVQAANYIGQMLANFLAPGSPPKEGPLANIVRWGKGLMDTFLRAFQLADFGIMRDVLDPIRQALESAVSAGDMSRPEMLEVFRTVRAEVAALIADFRQTGEISDEALASIAQRLGEGGEEYAEYLRLTLEHQQALERLKGIEEEVAAAEEAGFIPAELKERLEAAQAEVDARQEAVEWQREYLAALQEGADIQVEMLEALRELTEVLQGGGGGEEVGEGAAAVEPVEPLGGGVATPEMPAMEAFEGFGGFSGEFQRVRQEVEDFFTNLPAKLGEWLEQAKLIGAQKGLEIVENVRTTLLMIGAILLAKLLEIREKIRVTLLQIVAILLAKYLEIREQIRQTLLMIVAILLAKFLEIQEKVRTTLLQIVAILLAKFLEIREKVRVTLLMIAAIIAARLLEWYTAITGKIDEIKAWIGAQVEIWKTAGSDLLAGFWQGLKDKWEELKTWFTGAIGELPEWVKNLLGIHSPSTVFQWLGEMSAKGLQIGFGSAMQDLVGSARLSLTGAAGAAGGSPITIVLQGGMEFPNVRDGRDSKDFVQELIDRAADDAGVRARVPGGRM